MVKVMNKWIKIGAKFKYFYRYFNSQSILLMADRQVNWTPAERFIGKASAILLHLFRNNDYEGRNEFSGRVMREAQD